MAREHDSGWGQLFHMVVPSHGECTSAGPSEKQLVLIKLDEHLRTSLLDGAVLLGLEAPCIHTFKFSMCARIFDEGILLELRFRVAERGQGVAILERSRPNTYVLV